MRRNAVYLIAFPLLIVPFALYNMIAFLMPGVKWTDTIATIPLPSKVDPPWAVTAGDILLVFSILILFVEILKATRASMRTIIDHMLAMVLFIAMLIEFLLVKQAGTSTFFVLLAIAFVDVLGGFTVTVRTSQRTMEVENAQRITPL
jgi:hypothetical protein